MAGGGVVAWIGRVFSVIVGAARRLSGVDLWKTTAALSFATLLGMVPLFTVAFVAVARNPVFESWLDALERFLLRYLLAATGSAVRTYLAEFTAKAAALQGVGIAFLVVTALFTIATVERELNAIFRVRAPRGILRRIVVYALGLTAVPLAIGAAIYTTRWLFETSMAALPFADAALPLIARPIAIALLSLALSVLYALLPACRVPAKAALIGGLTAACAFELARHGFALYLARFSTYELIYGALAALPILLIWIYVSWIVVLGGAAIAAEVAQGGSSAHPRR